MIHDAAAGGPVVVVDVGGSFVKPGGQGVDPQAEGKASLVAAAMHLASTDAIALSATDWTLGRAFIADLAAKESLSVLAANLVCEGAAPFPGSKVVERGGRRVGVIGVTDGAVAGCEVGPIAEAVAREAAALGSVDVAVLLLPVEVARTRELLAGPLPVDLVLDLEPTRVSPDAERVGDHLVLGSGPRGQRVGLTSLAWRGAGRPWMSSRAAEQAQATITRLEGLQRSLSTRRETVTGSAAARLDQQLERVARDLEAARAAQGGALSDALRANVFTTRLVELDTSIADDPEVLARVKAWLTASAPPGPPAVAAGPRVGPPGGSWAGADVCAGCHPAESAQWLTTPHARAWTALVDDGHAGDNDCFACHSTGARVIGGPATAAAVGGLRDVQCEACHGPAQQHLADPRGIKPIARPAEATCRTCHDGDRDGGRFDPATYFLRVVHRAPELAPR